MGKKNVVLWDGTVAAVDQELADRLAGSGKAHPETQVEENSRLVGQYNAENTSGLRAAAEGAADTASFGLYGTIATRLDDESRAHYQVTAQEHPLARFAGEAAALALPSGELGEAAKVFSEGTAMGAIGRVGEMVGGGLKAQAVEGALYGLQGSIAHANVTGDPLTVEGALMDAGLGGVLNVGMGALGSRLGRSAEKAEESLAAKTFDAETVTKGQQVFEREYPVLDEFNAARKGSISEAEKFNREVAKEEEAYADFTRDPANGFTRVMKSVDRAINKVRGRYRPEGTFGSIDEALTSVEQQAGIKADELGLAPEGAVPSASVSTGPSGGTVGFSRNGNLPDGVRTRITERVKLSDKNPISPDVSEQLRGWRREASEIRQMFAGGRKVAGGGWGPVDESIARQPEAALARLQKLKEDIWKNAQDAAGEIPDIIPPPPRARVETPPELPRVKTLEYLSRMEPTSVAKMGNSLSAAEGQAVERLAGELGLETRPGNPGGTLADIHASLKRYRSAMDAAEAASGETTAAASGGFGRLLNHTSRLAGGRAGSRFFGSTALGGALGWASGSMLGGVVGGALMGTLLNGKAGLRNKLSELIATHGRRAGRVITGLGPVASSLGVQIVSGLKDKGDTRTLAARRAREITALRGVAPDLSYSAFEPLMQAPNDIALKLHSRYITTINHLADTAPKDPGLDMKGFQSNWSPSLEESYTFAHRMEAAFYPMQSIGRILSGHGHPAGAETLWTAWPAMMGALSEELASSPEIVEKLSHRELGSLSQLLRTPLSGFQIPEISLAAQAMYQPGAPGNPYNSNPSAGFGDSPSAQPQGGRPPEAGVSQVAGSNVSRLTE